MSYKEDIEAIDNDDPGLEDRLNQIAMAIAAKQGKVVVTSDRVDAPIDPSEAFACEGCQ